MFSSNATCKTSTHVSTIHFFQQSFKQIYIEVLLNAKDRMVKKDTFSPSGNFNMFSLLIGENFEWQRDVIETQGL